MKRIVFTGTFLLITLLGWSQDILKNDSIDEVYISANRLVNFTTGAKIHRINKSELLSFESSELNALLSDHSMVTIKSYGYGGLSTISMRGSGASHTAVLWNGFNLQSPMNGTLDMGLIPVGFVDEIQLQYGGSGALFGSGAVGGIVHLSNDIDFNKGIDLSISTGVGSFNNLNNGLNIGYSAEKFATSFRINYDYGENNFPYVNDQQFNDPTVYQINALQERYGIMQSNLLKINDNQKITTHLWYQDGYNEIPPNMTVTKSAQFQTNEALRFSTEWERKNNRMTQFLRAGYFYDHSIYNDPLIELTSKNTAKSFIAEFENKIVIGSNHTINIGINETYEAGITKNYAKDRYRNRAALFLSYKLFNNTNTLASVISFREELIDNTFAPITYSVGLRWTPVELIGVNANFSKNYKIPGLNDLYWAMGGNPDLLPEEGYSSDLGITMKKDFESFDFDLNLTGFYNRISNWIIWYQQGSIWTPENLDEVLSRGIESSLAINMNGAKWDIGLSMNYHYTHSTLEKSNVEELIGNQIIYVPKHKGNIACKIGWNGYSLTYIQNLIGKRYVTKDNTYAIDGYTIANIVVAKKVDINRYDFNIRFRVNNLWNESYEVMYNYAMPMRHYMISLSFNLHEPLNKN